MKKTLLIIGLLAVGLVLSGCGQGAPEAPTPEPPSIQGVMGTQAPPMENWTAPPLPEGYDPSAEEDTDGEPVVGFTPDAPVQEQESVQAAPVQVYSTQYAGSTPMPLDPIDMPTPPPRQPLTFTYAGYTATNLGLTFESVAGYEEDASAGDAYILRQPENQVVDNYRVEFIFTTEPVAGNYQKNDIRATLRGKLEALGREDYRTWQPTNLEERGLLNAPGYYANYRGVKTDGTIVRGRIHSALLPGNRLLTVHMTCPAEYNTDYTRVFTHIRSTLKTN